MSTLDSTTATAMMVYFNFDSALKQRIENERNRRMHELNNRACVLMSSRGQYSEASKIFERALLIHREHIEKSSSLPSVSTPPLSHAHSDLDFSEEGLSEFDDDFSEMDWDGKDNDWYGNASVDSQLNDSHTNSSNINIDINSPSPPTLSKRNIGVPRMTDFSRLQAISYCGQPRGQHSCMHQVYILPIVMEATEWDTAPIQDKTFVLVFNTALCNHLWGMQMIKQYIVASTVTDAKASATSSINAAAIVKFCQETLTVAKLLYKLALENSVSFSNGVSKMCYVALYNNLSHVVKTLDGDESAGAEWCDDMLLKAIFWWREQDSTYRQHQLPIRNNSSSSHHLATDRYLDEDVEVIDAFLDNVFYRVGVSEYIVPAAAA